MVQARKKLVVEYTDPDEFDNVNTIMRIRIPFFTQEELQKIKEEEMHRQMLE
jgi:hypothetical protein